MIVCRPIGDLDRYTFASFADQITELIRPNVHFVFDLSELGFMDTTGLRTLRATTRRIRRGAGEAHVRNATTRMARLLTMSRVVADVPVSRRLDSFIPGPLPAS
jgi:anti-anti-sigma factor